MGVTGAGTDSWTPAHSQALILHAVRCTMISPVHVHTSISFYSQCTIAHYLQSSVTHTQSHVKVWQLTVRADRVGIPLLTHPLLGFPSFQDPLGCTGYLHPSLSVHLDGTILPKAHTFVRPDHLLTPHTHTLHLSPAKIALSLSTVI